MILVFSTQDWERSTEDVMDWIRALGGECVRYNGEDLIGSDEYSLELSPEGHEVRLSCGEASAISGAGIGAVWYRRGGRYAEFSVHPFLDDHETSAQIDAHLRAEMTGTAAALHQLLANVPWLTRPDQRRVNKIAVLQKARDIGLDIPATIITNSRARLERFAHETGRIVTKAISDGTAFYVGEKRYTLFTEEVTAEDIAALPATFLPTLAQERLEKSFEVRVFYLGGACYPMAIFSQGDPQTVIDFRRYNRQKPNRSVPYRLTREVEERLVALMKELDLETGSLDLVRTRCGRTVFLEVNPVGQFGMVSGPCNYRLEKAVARHLLSLEASFRRGRGDDRARDS